jgi:hypothetical protein
MRLWPRRRPPTGGVGSPVASDVPSGPLTEAPETPPETPRLADSESQTGTAAESFLCRCGFSYPSAEGKRTYSTAALLCPSCWEFGCRSCGRAAAGIYYGFCRVCSDADKVPPKERRDLERRPNSELLRGPLVANPEPPLW